MTAYVEAFEAEAAILPPSVPAKAAARTMLRAAANTADAAVAGPAPEARSAVAVVPPPVAANATANAAGPRARSGARDFASAPRTRAAVAIAANLEAHLEAHLNANLDASRAARLRASDRPGEGVREARSLDSSRFNETLTLK